MRRLLLCCTLALAGIAAVTVAPAGSDPSPVVSATRGCGYLDVPGGRAWKIFATRIDCTPARRVARTCLRGHRPSGWSVSYNATNDRTMLRSGRRVVSFQVVGGGGCIPVRAQIAARPTVRVTPATIAPGDRATFTGSGWPAGKAVELLIGPPRSEADRFAWARAGADGRFRRSFRFSSSAQPGRYVVLACRRSCRIKAAVRLTIER